MSKQEFLKTQTCVLKVNIHCEGCKAKVKKVLHKIEGVYTIAIDAELGKVTVSGNVDPATLIKKLNKKGKFAEIWGGTVKNQLPSSNGNNQNQMKNLQIGNGKGGNNNKNQQPQKGAPVNNSQPNGGVPPQAQNQQLQQLQQLKALQDLRNQMKVAPNEKDQKSGKLNFPAEEGLSDDEFETDDEFDDYDDEDEDEFEDEIGAPPVNKMKPVMGNPQQQMANMMMVKNMLNGQQQQQQGIMKDSSSNGANVRKPVAGGNIPAPFNSGGSNDGGKKGGGGGNTNNSGGGKNGGGKSGMNGGGPPLPQDGKNVGGGEGKNSGGHGGAPNVMGNGSKKGMMMMTNDGHHRMPNMMPMNGMGPTGNTPMAHPHMAQIPNNPSPNPFPSAAAAAGGYFPPIGPDQMAGIPYNPQQQYAAMMMNMQRANGNERFQPMVYARPPPAVSYMPPSYPPHPYPYYQEPRAGDEYSIFSDENTQSCIIM